MSDETRTIYVTLTDGSVHEVSGIPAGAKITYATVNPNGNSGGRVANDPCLRIYKGSRDNGDQLAVIRGVESFIDRTLTMRPAVKKQDWIDGDKKFMPDDPFISVVK